MAAVAGSRDGAIPRRDFGPGDPWRSDHPERCMPVLTGDRITHSRRRERQSMSVVATSRRATRPPPAGTPGRRPVRSNS